MENTNLTQIKEQIAEVASNVRGSEDGQGVFYNADKKLVLWSGGDSDFTGEYHGSDWDDVESNLLKINGVNNIILVAEESPEDYDEENNEENNWIKINYKRSDDAEAWSRWYCIEVMKLKPKIVDETWEECGLPILPYPEDCV